MENMTERYGTRGFSKVPIEDSQNNTIEVFNVYSSLDTSKNKCKKKNLQYYFSNISNSYYFYVKQNIKNNSIN